MNPLHVDGNQCQHKQQTTYFYENNYIFQNKKKLGGKVALFNICVNLLMAY